MNLDIEDMQEKSAGIHLLIFLWCNSYFSKINAIHLSLYYQQLLYLQKEPMKQTIINKLRQFFAYQPIEKAWVFGSYSRGEETKDSDIDILVRFAKDANITLFKYVSIADALQKLLHKKIDLVEEGQLKDFAKDSAEQDKILIYEREA